MQYFTILPPAVAFLCSVAFAAAQQPDRCAELTGLNLSNVEITKAEMVPAGTTVPPPYPGAPAIGPLPAHCPVEGVLARRKGVDGQEFGIGFALALPQPQAWHGDFMIQGGGGNGVVAYPAGANFAGNTPTLSRGFAVASTDTDHKAKTGPFDFSFMRDQQAYLDFAFLANAEVAAVAKQIIAHYYAKPASYSYFVGCSTGGREGMILSQRYPTAFNGIVSGDSAMRTGLSNLAIAQWIPVATERRAADLMHRMTLAEKATQMQNNSAEIQRLKVPAYQWWSEALHGVINEGVTEYPEPVGLALACATMW